MDDKRYSKIIADELIGANNWDNISRRYKMDDNFILEFANKLKLNTVFKRYNVSKELLDKIVDKYQDNVAIPWGIFFYYSNDDSNRYKKFVINLDDVKKYYKYFNKDRMDEICYSFIDKKLFDCVKYIMIQTNNIKLIKDIIENDLYQYTYKLPTDLILDDELVLTYDDKTWEHVSCRKDLTDDLIEKYIDKLDFNRVFIFNETVSDDLIRKHSNLIDYIECRSIIARRNVGSLS